MLVVQERPGLPAPGFGMLSQPAHYGLPGQAEQSFCASEVASLVASASLTSTFGARFHPLVDAVRQRFAQDVALLQVGAGLPPGCCREPPVTAQPRHRPPSPVTAGP